MIREIKPMQGLKQVEQKETAARLSQLGVRPLSYRIAVYRYLSGTKSHPTADMIYEGLKPAMPSLSRTTVYNVLNHLCDKGAVRRVSIEDHELRFDADITDHIHFKCKACSQVFDMMGVVFPKIEKPEGFTVDSVQVNIEGACPSCNKKLG